MRVKGRFPGRKPYTPRRPSPIWSRHVRVAIAVGSHVVRLCTAMRTVVGQPYKLGLPWEGSGVSSYAVAFEAAREGLEADMDANTAPLCGHAAALKAHLGQAEAEAQQWLEAQGGD